MRVNPVSFTAGVRRKPTAPLGHTNTVPTSSKANIKAADLISISGLLGASLLSVYFIKKGNLDVGMKLVHI